MVRVPRAFMPRQTCRLIDPGRNLRASVSECSLVICLLVVSATGCSRHIEDEPPIPEHRYETTESWCALMFDPECPAQELEDVKDEEECFDKVLRLDIVWAPIGDGEDACAATLIPFVDCLTTLSCSEIQQHFALTNIVPAEDRSSCGALAQAQLDCQTAHY